MLNKIFQLVVVVMLTTVGCRTTEKRNSVVQVSLIDALLAGVYDGEVSLEELLKYGNLGIGTFAGLDGEMIVYQGKIYQVKADGKVYRPALTEKTPFATVVNFTPEKISNLQQVKSIKSLIKRLDNITEQKNLFYAVCLKATFKSIKVRSVPQQTKPYPPLTEVVKNQPIFNYQNIAGVLVGFRCPSYVKGVNVPGWHLHFLSDDKQAGGHLLDCNFSKAKIAIDKINNFKMILLKDSKYFNAVNLKKDRSKELHKVEK